MVTYSSLDSDVKEIRLLRVLPGHYEQDSSSSAFIHCELSIHRLDEANPPSYTALSYVWGPEPTVTASQASNTLILNGEYITARENLLFALRSFQKRGDEGYLWVDAVCINQTDMEEKKFQIALMGQIYSLAERTLIWLGPAEGDSDLGMEFVAQAKAQDLDAERFELHTRCLRAVMALLQRSWWTRVWILQEAFLSKLPIARCGDKDVQFERFVALKRLHEDSYKSSPAMWRKYMLFQNVRFVYCLSNWEIARRELVTKGGSSPFSWMCSTSSRLLSTVPHDKVYGVLGLCTTDDQACFKADYDIPLRDVIIDVVARSLKTDSFMCLSCVLPQEIRTAGLELPSWVPDLTALDLTQNLIPCRYKANLSPMDQAWTALVPDPNITADEATLVWSSIRQLEVLIIYGCLCDVVTFASPMPVVPQYEGFDADVAEQTKAERVSLTIETFKKWEALALEMRDGLPEPYKDCIGGRKGAFWRTLSCDSGVRGAPYPLPLDFGDRYEALLGRQPPLNSDKIVDDPIRNDWVREYGVPACAKCVNKSFFLTQQGRMGMTIRGVQEGDIVVIARGGFVPYVVRHRPDWGMTFIGEAYLHGVMDGEGVLDAVRQGWNLLKFHLR